MIYKVVVKMAGVTKGEFITVAPNASNAITQVEKRFQTPYVRDKTVYDFTGWRGYEFEARQVSEEERNNTYTVYDGITKPRQFVFLRIALRYMAYMIDLRLRKLNNFELYDSNGRKVL